MEKSTRMTSVQEIWKWKRENIFDEDVDMTVVLPCRLYLYIKTWVDTVSYVYKRGMQWLRFLVWLLTAGNFGFSFISTSVFIEVYHYESIIIYSNLVEVGAPPLCYMVFSSCRSSANSNPSLSINSQ